MRIKKRTRPADFGASARDSFTASSPEGEGPAEDILESASTDVQPTWSTSEPPRFHSAITETLPRPPVRLTAPNEVYEDVQPDAFKPPPAWPVYLVALAVAGLWALGPIAFALGYRAGVIPLRDDNFALMVFGLLAIGPGAFVFFAAYMVRQGQKLGAESRRAKAMAEEMLAPAVAAAARAGHVAQGVREEILRAGAAADEARETLLALREALAAESERLVESTELSVRSTQELTTTLGRERSEMGALAHSLDAQATRVVDSITQQARMVAEASGVAETQLREAEAALSARAADIAAAAGDASTATRNAGEDLTRHIARLENAGAGVAEQVRAVEGGLTEQRTALVTLAQTLKADNEDFTDQAELHAAKLSDFINQTRLSSVELGERAAQGGETLRALMADAIQQFRELTEAAKAEREELGQSTLQSLESVSTLLPISALSWKPRRERLSRRWRLRLRKHARPPPATRPAPASRSISISEAAFSAGQKANQVFEARLTEARTLVEQSSEIVDQAGAATATRLEESAAAARASLCAFQDMMAEIDQRASKLPASAQNQIDLVRVAVVEGLQELSAQARRTAEEAQIIDAAFQERARRNFEMLSEAVRLMGASAAMPAASLASLPPAPPPAAAASQPARSKPASPKPEPLPEPPFAVVDEDADGLEELMEPAAPREPVEDPGLRPRLKLTPTATDEEFTAVFEAAGGLAGDQGEAPHEGESWTWKDLLASIDGADGDGERLQDILGDQLSKMGVEPAKLLPKARIDEIAAAVQTGDTAGARTVVKRLAPAATRRIQRRLFTDDDLKRQAEVYIRRYQTLVDDAMVRDPEGFLMANLLGDDGGRLYLLLDAAAGDQD